MKKRTGRLIFFMGYIKAKVVNCKKASIRRHPWIPLHANDIVDIKEGTSKDTDIVKKGTTIMIDPDNVSYDWTDRKFYKVRNPDGWIYEGCVDYGSDDGG